MDLTFQASVQTEDLRKVMRHWTTGVAVVTATGEDGTPAGLVSNSFTSVSLDPPLVSWCVDRRSSSFRTWSRTDAFSVHILGAEDAGLVPRFAARGTDKFADLRTTCTALGTPALDDVTVRLDCSLWNRYDGGDHVILIGEVQAVDAPADLRPLTSHQLSRR